MRAARFAIYIYTYLHIYACMQVIMPIKKFKQIRAAYAEQVEDHATYGKHVHSLGAPLLEQQLR